MKKYINLYRVIEVYKVGLVNTFERIITIDTNLMFSFQSNSKKVKGENSKTLI